MGRRLIGSGGVDYDNVAIRAREIAVESERGEVAQQPAGEPSEVAPELLREIKALIADGSKTGRDAIYTALQGRFSIKDVKAALTQLFPARSRGRPRKRNM